MATATATATATAHTSGATAPVDLHDVHVVLRGNGFVADGIQRERGEVLVTKGWRNVAALVNQRYLGAPDYSLGATIVACACGRRWENDERASAHACPARKD